MSINKPYKPAVDVLRILAILGVVLIHTTTKTIQASNNDLQAIPFTLFLNQVFRFAVPLFFMISGFILELNYHLNGNFLVYLKKRISRIFLPFVFWSGIYYFFVFFQGRNPNFLNSLFKGDASYQLYFIPALLIFYLIFPLLHKYFKIIGNSWVLAFLFVVQLILLHYDYQTPLTLLAYPLRISLLNYFLFIFGIFIAKHYASFITFLNKWKIVLFFGSIIFAFIVFFEGFNGYLSTHNYLTFYSQWRPSVLLYTLFLGGSLYWVFDKKLFNSDLVKTLSKLSFFVFFVHVVIIEIFWELIGEKYFQLHFTQNFWWDPVFFFVVAGFSFLIGYLVHKSNFMAKITG